MNVLLNKILFDPKNIHLFGLNFEKSLITLHQRSSSSMGLLVGNNLKKGLIALILFTLILASFTLISTSNVKAQTSEAQVLSYSWYVAPTTTTTAQYIGDLIAVGEVTDVGSNPLSRVIVTGVAYNATGGALASAEAPAFTTLLLPGQKAPFYLDFAPQSSVTQDQSWVPFVTNITVSVAFVSDSNQTQYTGLQIPAGSVSAALDSTGTYTVTGTVQNNGNQATGQVWVVSTFYNASGTVVGLNYTNYLTDSLSPGNLARFTATPMDNTAQLSSSITNYSLLIQYLPYTAQATNTPVSTPTPTYSQTASSQPTASPAPLSLGSIYIIVIVVVVILVVLAAAVLFWKRRQNAKFEPPPPPPPPPPP